MNETSTLSPTAIAVIFNSLGLLLLLSGWILFKAGIYSIGFLTGFILSFLFIFSLEIDKLFIEIIVFIILGGVIGFIFARCLWHIHKYILALMGLFTSILINFHFKIPSLLEADGTRILYLIIVSVLSMALFVLAEKFLIIFLTSLFGALIMYHFFLLEWMIGERISELIKTYLSNSPITPGGVNIFIFLLLMATGIIVQTSFKRRKKKDESERTTENT